MVVKKMGELGKLRRRKRKGVSERGGTLRVGTLI
jgi:hypothetical protein